MAFDLPVSHCTLQKHAGLRLEVVSVVIPLSAPGSLVSWAGHHQISFMPITRVVRSRHHPGNGRYELCANMDCDDLSAGDFCLPSV